MYACMYVYCMYVYIYIYIYIYIFPSGGGVSADEAHDSLPQVLPPAARAARDVHRRNGLVPPVQPGAALLPAASCQVERVGLRSKMTWLAAWLLSCLSDRLHWRIAGLIARWPARQPTWRLRWLAISGTSDLCGCLPLCVCVCVRGVCVCVCVCVCLCRVHARALPGRPAWLPASSLRGYHSQQGSATLPRLLATCFSTSSSTTVRRLLSSPLAESRLMLT